MKFDIKGPFSIMIGEPARIEDVVQYADFTEKVSPTQVVDESTSDEQPDMDNLVDIKNGTLKLKNSNVHILPEGKPPLKIVFDILYSVI